MWETSQWGDCLFSRVVLCSSVVLHHFAILCVDSITNTVDLFVDLSTMVIPLLTSSGHGELDTTGMPSTDTGNLTKTLVCLPWQFFTMPPGGYTLNK